MAESSQTSGPVEDDCAAQRRVRIARSTDIDEVLGRELIIDLRTELARRDIAVCESDAPDRAAMAEVVVSTTPTRELRIDVLDRLTDKEVSRSLRVDKLPADGRALAVALAIDELLRASWAELSWRRPEPPKPVEEPPASKPAPTPAPSPLAFSVLGSFDGIGSRYRALGAQLAMDAQLLAHGWLAVRTGPGRMLEVTTSAGKLSATVLAAEADLGVCSPWIAKWKVCGGLGPRLEALWLDATPRAGFAGSSSSTTVLSARAAAQARRELLPRLFISAQALLGWTLLGAELSDGQATLLELEGLHYGVALGLGAPL